MPPSLAGWRCSRGPWQQPVTWGGGGGAPSAEDGPRVALPLPLTPGAIPVQRLPTRGSAEAPRAQHSTGTTGTAAPPDSVSVDIFDKVTGSIPWCARVASLSWCKPSIPTPMERTLLLGHLLEVFDQVETLLHAYDPTGTASLHRCSDGELVLQLATQWPLRPGMGPGLRALTESLDLIWTRLHVIPDTLTLRANIVPDLTELGVPPSLIAQG